MTPLASHPHFVVSFCLSSSGMCCIRLCTNWVCSRDRSKAMTSPSVSKVWAANLEFHFLLYIIYEVFLSCEKKQPCSLGGFFFLPYPNSRMLQISIMFKGAVALPMCFSYPSLTHAWCFFCCAYRTQSYLVKPIWCSLWFRAVVFTSKDRMRRLHGQPHITVAIVIIIIEWSMMFPPMHVKVRVFR